MRRVMVRYKVKADRVEENKQLIADVFAQLKREKPAGLRYASFNLGDGVRIRNEITDLNEFLVVRMNRVVPVAMKGVGDQLDACHLLVGHHHAHGIGAAVDL